MPREVFQAADRRASVVIPICNVNGIASILFERRSTHVRTHKQQVCFPGGMVDEAVDATIVQTSLREMEEEIGIPPDRAEVSYTYLNASVVLDLHVVVCVVVGARNTSMQLGGGYYLHRHCCHSRCVLYW